MCAFLSDRPPARPVRSLALAPSVRFEKCMATTRHDSSSLISFAATMLNFSFLFYGFCCVFDCAVFTHSVTCHYYCYYAVAAGDGDDAAIVSLHVLPHLLPSPACSPYPPPSVCAHSIYYYLPRQILYIREYLLHIINL